MRENNWEKDSYTYIVRKLQGRANSLALHDINSSVNAN